MRDSKIREFLNERWFLSGNEIIKTREYLHELGVKNATLRVPFKKEDYGELLTFEYVREFVESL